MMTFSDEWSVPVQQCQSTMIASTFLLHHILQELQLIQPKNEYFSQQQHDQYRPLLINTLNYIHTLTYVVHLYHIRKLCMYVCRYILILNGQDSLSIVTGSVKIRHLLFVAKYAQFNHNFFVNMSTANLHNYQNNKKLEFKKEQALISAAKSKETIRCANL